MTTKKKCDSNYDDIMLPIITSTEQKIINNTKAKFWLITWTEYILKYIETQIAWWKKILNQENITKNKLPFNINVHLEKIDRNEHQKILKKLNSLIKTVKDKNTKN